jgi:hypothetical protein
MILHILEYLLALAKDAEKRRKAGKDKWKRIVKEINLNRKVKL